MDRRGGGTCDCMQELPVVSFRQLWIGILFYAVQSTRVYVEHRFFGVNCKALQVGVEYAFG